MPAGQGVADFGPVFGPAGFGAHGEMEGFVVVDAEGGASGEAEFGDFFVNEGEKFAVDLENAAVGESASAKAETAVDRADGTGVFDHAEEVAAAFAAGVSGAEADADAGLLEIDAENADYLGGIENVGERALENFDAGRDDFFSPLFSAKGDWLRGGLRGNGWLGLSEGGGEEEGG